LEGEKERNLQTAKKLKGRKRFSSTAAKTPTEEVLRRLVRGRLISARNRKEERGTTNMMMYGKPLGLLLHGTKQKKEKRIAPSEERRGIPSVLRKGEYGNTSQPYFHLSQNK